MDRFDRWRFQTVRTIADAGLRAAVIASRPSDRLWRWKNGIADGMVMACAFGGPANLLDIPVYPVTILARVSPAMERLELYACDPQADGVSGLRRSQFSLVESVPAIPMFEQGGVHMFMTPDQTGSQHYFVRAYANGRPHDSDILVSKIDTAPTERRDGILQSSAGLLPTFRWPEIDGWISYLMILEGAERKLVTGVYSWGSEWRFPEVRQQPFFYHPLDPTPVLTPGTDYEAVYVAVDKDRWIGYLDSLKFTAGE
jgi:hypothetical protein